GAKRVVRPQLLPFLLQKGHGCLPIYCIDPDTYQIATIYADHKNDGYDGLVKRFKMKILHHAGYKSPSSPVVKLLANRCLRTGPTNRPHCRLIEDKSLGRITGLQQIKISPRHQWYAIGVEEIMAYMNIRNSYVDLAESSVDICRRVLRI